MPDSRPALLVDVDGVLNPYAAAEVPPDYVEHRYQPGLRWGPEGLRVWLNPAHGPLLTAFADANGLVLVWATTWEHGANRWIAPRIGLTKELPVIEFDGLGGWGKLPVVARWAADRRFAWLDDNFGPGDEEWAQRRTAGGVPTLLVPIRPEVGLRRSDLDRIAGWVATL